MPAGDRDRLEEHRQLNPDPGAALPRTLGGYEMKIVNSLAIKLIVAIVIGAAIGVVITTLIEG